MIYHGNNIDVLKTFEDNSVDSIVTDPPYGLSFINKHWDYDVPSVELWKECLRVLKPGGHLLSFFGTRTYHRGTVRIENAGFEIRDMISWIYGSGFPKSMDISKAIEGKIKNGTSNKKDFSKLSGERLDRGNWGIAKMQNVHGQRDKNYDTETEQIDRLGKLEATTPEAIQWNGWGTALKPACEPICVARKPVNGTIAGNVLKYGTGGINIDGCRIGITDNSKNNWKPKGYELKNSVYEYGSKEIATEQNPAGRFPANIIFDEIAGVMLDEQSGESNGSRPNLEIGHTATNRKGVYSSIQNSLVKNNIKTKRHPDTGGASRFFYCAKASKAERNGGLEGFEEIGVREKNEGNPENWDLSKGKVRERMVTKPQSNHHPTVKPLKLMQYLVRLVTPPNGICLDPFCGSGTTLMACVKEGFNYIGIEREADYVKIAEARIEWVKKQKETEPEQLSLL